MTERSYRFILGGTLILMLYNQKEVLILGYIGLLFFEGLTNWRIPIIVSRIRYGTAANVNGCPPLTQINFDAERALRIVVALLLMLTYVVFNEETWFFPWFVGYMLLAAGFTNICPMYMVLRWMGFK